MYSHELMPILEAAGALLPILGVTILKLKSKSTLNDVRTVYWVRNGEYVGAEARRKGNQTAVFVPTGSGVKIRVDQKTHTVKDFLLVPKTEHTGGLTVEPNNQQRLINLRQPTPQTARDKGPFEEIQYLGPVENARALEEFRQNFPDKVGE